MVLVLLLIYYNLDLGLDLVGIYGSIFNYLFSYFYLGYMA